MNRLFCLLFIAAAFSLPSCEAKQPEATTDKSLLWRISKKGEQTSYLFGTMHLICRADYVWTDAMKKALHEAEEVCFEMDMDDPAVLSETTAGVMEKPVKPLRDWFTADEYARLAAFSKDSMGMDLAMLQQMRPVVLQTLFSTKTVACPFPESYEANIMMDAKKEQKNIVGLEQPAEQIDLLMGMSDDSTAHTLLSLVDSFASSRAEYGGLLAAYKQQDLPLLYAEMMKSNELGSNMSAFLDDRNKRWISRMGKMMQQHSEFFAVGAGHLWGVNGVIALLRKAGYEVVAVN